MWGGFEMKYPYEDYTSHFDNLFEAIEFTTNSTPEGFANGLDRYYNIENLVDYFLFVNLIRATDNLGKNYYLARYHAKTPYFIVPWDMDGTLGTIQDGKRIPTTDDVLSNHLFDRLWNENPNAYRSKIIARWSTLRTGTFSNEKLHQRIEKRYQKLLENRCYERDAMIWETQHEPEHLEYLQTWLHERLEYLDSYFKE
jgi:spore coat protein CotH